jgi:beta-N-acetylhexosaminidase
MDFAPVVDVVDPTRMGKSNGLVSRTFGRSREEAATLAGEFLRTLQANGITGCLKHFPGLGASSVDSHEELPVVEIEEDEWRSIDLYPYRELLANGTVRAVMAAHAAFPRADLQETGQDGKLLPSSLSYNIVTSLLRGDLSYDGLVITDDLEMGAIKNNYGIGDACKMAITAGVDMLAICADPEAIRQGYAAVLGAVNSGEIGIERIDRSLDRIMIVKSQMSEPQPFDPDRIASLSQRVVHLTERSQNAS